MEKYGTYRVFQNKITGEIKKELINTSEEDLEKIAQNNEWVELTEDPDYE